MDKCKLYVSKALASKIMKNKKKSQVLVEFHYLRIFEKNGGQVEHS